jgi:hypothetical protein
MRIARGPFSLAAALSLAFVAACQAPPPPPPPPVVVAPPPPPLPPPPPIAPPKALATRIIEDASTFRAYMTTTSGISADFKDADQVAAGVRTATAFEQTQLQQGAIAYVAVMALQEPTFVSTVREYATDPEQRAQIVHQILADPSYAATFPGADKAAGLAVAALDGMGAKVLVAGKQVKQAAYDVQHQAWSKTNVANPDVRLTDTKARSGQRILASLTDVEDIRKASLQGAAMSVAGQPVAPPYTRTVVNGLAIAALAALGEAGDDKLDRLQPLLTDETSGYCLNMSKLNLYQCLAVSKPQYEDIFCLGQHSMIDIGQCVVKAAGSPTPAYVEPPPMIPEPVKVTKASRRVTKKKK